MPNARIEMKHTRESRSVSRDIKMPGGAIAKGLSCSTFSTTPTLSHLKETSCEHSIKIDFLCLRSKNRFVP